MDVVRLIQQGGLCMLPLLLMSVVAVAVSLDRIIYFASLEWGGGRFRETWMAYLRQGRAADGLLWLNHIQGPMAQVLKAVLSRLDQSRSSIQNAMALACQDSHARLHQHLSLLETFVTVSPLIGLLGTITGMMSVFRQVAEKMSANPQADTSGILAGIGEALVATASGILVAVACLVLHNLFQYLAERQMQRTQLLTREIFQVMEETHGLA